MSAFVLSTDHIDLLVTALVRYDVRASVKGGIGAPANIDLSDPHAVGRLLLEENVKSVLARYGDGVEADEQADYAADIFSYHYERVVLSTSTLGAEPAVALLLAVSCYVYQACEHGGWETSRARMLMEHLEATLMEGLPGMDIDNLPGMDKATTWNYVRTADGTS